MPKRSIVKTESSIGHPFYQSTFAWINGTMLQDIYLNGAYQINIYLLLTEFEGRTVSYGPSFFLLNLWPKREARIRNLQYGPRKRG